MSQATRYIIFSQVSLFAFIALCTILMPHFLFERNEGGASNYGLHSRTIIPYSLANGLAGLGLILAAFRTPRTPKIQLILKISASVFGALYLIILVSTRDYKVSHLYNLVHVDSTLVLFIFETALAIFLVSRCVRSLKSRLFFLVQFAGFIVLLLTLFNQIHLLFIGETLTSLGFALLYTAAFSELTKQSQKN